MSEGVEERFPADGSFAEAEEAGVITSHVEEEPTPQEVIGHEDVTFQVQESTGEEGMTPAGDADVQTPPQESAEAATEEEDTIIPPLTRPGLELSEEEEFGSMEDFLKEEYDYVQPHRGDLLTGRVISVASEGLLVDVGLKREGIVPASDLTRLDRKTRQDIQVGDEIPVYVLRASDQDGNLILSLFRAQMEADWLKARQLMESGEIWEGKVTGYNRGGLVVPFGRIRGFVPASQIIGFPKRLTDEAREKKLAAMEGEILPLKVMEVDRRRRRLILSHRAAWWDWKEVQRKRLLEELQEGEVRHGVVSSLRDFGAFVDLGGADGLIHVSELSWERVDHPRDVLKVGDEVDVVVVSVDRERGRIGLSLKQLKPEPWSLVPDKYHVDQLVEGVVTRVSDFGVFVKLEEGIEGLIHKSELADIEPQRPGDLVKEGDLLLLRVLRVEPERKRIGLSLRQVSEEEWADWAASFRAKAAQAASQRSVPEEAEEIVSSAGGAPVDVETEAPLEAEDQAEPFAENAESIEKQFVDESAGES